MRGGHLFSSNDDFEDAFFAAADFSATGDAIEISICPGLLMPAFQLAFSANDLVIRSTPMIVVTLLKL